MRSSLTPTEPPPRPSKTSLRSRFFELRDGEGRVVIQAFATLFLIIAAHTMLETARDALFLAKLPANQLNVMYVVLAGVTFVAAAASVRLGRRVGRRNALIASLACASVVTLVFHFIAPTARAVLGLYVFSGLVGAVLMPQFWMLAAKLFTVAQGRRLFGLIASGGVVGGVAGAGTAAIVLEALPVSALFVVAATLFIAASAVLTRVTVEDTVVSAAVAPTPGGGRVALLRDQPFLIRIAALVAISTATVLVVDYLFKSSVARLLPPAALGSFFARYYAALNFVSLAVQLFVASRLIRRVGIVGAIGVMPILLLTGAVGVVFGGGILIAILVLKGVDGGLRHSLNRVASELLYLPLPSDARERGKGFIDGGLSRIVQAAMAGILLVLGTGGLTTPRTLAFIIVGLCVAWLAVAASVRGAYLDLFRRALSEGGITLDPNVDELDLRSTELLVESMASPDPTIVTAAMTVLEQHGRASLVPALVLYHDSSLVLVHALQLFAASTRTDWIPLAERLLNHASEPVRVAAVRALGSHGRVDVLRKSADDLSPRVRTYAAFHLAHREPEVDLIEHPLLSVVMATPGEFGHAGRLGLLAAISDSPDERATDLVIAFAQRRDLDHDEEAAAQIARAIARIKSPGLIPVAIARLANRTGREAMRDALVAIGDPALAALEETLADLATDRRVRLHVPRSIARFLSQHASDVLVDRLGTETDGLVRYKVLAGLGQLVARSNVKIDRPRIEIEVRRNLEEYVRLFAQRAALEERPLDSPSGQLLDGLLRDKLGQSLVRAFRLLKIAYKDEDIHRVHTAALSSDKRARANAGEFLDTLLAKRSQAPLRALLRVVVDDAGDEERVDRAAELVSGIVRGHDAVLASMINDHDDGLAALAAYHALSLGRSDFQAVVDRARTTRPALQRLGERFFGVAGSMPELSHAG